MGQHQGLGLGMIIGIQAAIRDHHEGTIDLTGKDTHIDS
jgi:hypothetical protein